MRRNSLSFSLGLLMFLMILLPGFSVLATQNSDWEITEISRISTGGDAYSILVEDEYCYITCGYSGFKIFDVSDKANPVRVANIAQQSDGYAHQFILKDNIVYIGNGNGGIWIINCIDPENPFVIANYRHDYSWDIKIKGDILFSGNGHIVPQESITVTNISDLSNPVHINTILTNDDITDLELIDNKLYAASSTDGLYIFDITNSTYPELLGNYSDPEHPEIHLSNFEVVSDLIYTGYYQYGLKVLDSSNSSNITQVLEFQNSSGNYYSIKRFEDLLYVSDISNGFKIYDISNRTNPVEIESFYYEDCGTNDIFRDENSLFVADRINGLIIFNIGDPNLTTPPTTPTTSTTSSEGTIGFDIFLTIFLFFLMWTRRNK